MSADARLMSVRDVSRWAWREGEFNWRRCLTWEFTAADRKSRDHFISQAVYRHRMARWLMSEGGYITKP